jgi:hypothetical protein
VSPTGSDSNVGSLSAPWRTVQKALGALSAGQRAFVRAGTYSQNLIMTRDGTATNPITISAYPGERPILQPGGGDSCNNVLQLSNVSYVRVAGLTFQGANGCDNNTNVYVAGSSSHVEISGNEIRNGHDTGLFTDPGTLDVHVLANRIHDNGTVGSGNKDHAMYMEGTAHLIANNLIYDHPFGHAVQIYPQADGYIITNNTIVNTSYTTDYRAAGIVVGGDGEGATADDILIVNNIVAWNDYGLYGYYPADKDGPSSSGSVARANLLYRNRFGTVVNDRPIIASMDNVVGRRPLFVDWSARDFRLRPGSPALDRALSGYAMEVDYTGRSRAGRPDLGAIELARPR